MCYLEGLRITVSRKDTGIADQAENWSGCLFSSLSQWEKNGWVIETTASTLWAGALVSPHPVLRFAPRQLVTVWEMLSLTSHTGSQFLRRVPREAGSLSSEKQNREEKVSQG